MPRKKKRLGRPPIDKNERLSERLVIKFRPPDMKMLRERIGKEELSGWARDTILKAASRKR